MAVDEGVSLVVKGPDQAGVGPSSGMGLVQAGLCSSSWIRFVQDEVAPPFLILAVGVGKEPSFRPTTRAAFGPTKGGGPRRDGSESTGIGTRGERSPAICSTSSTRGGRTTPFASRMASIKS
jgi:hypothetical protein